VATADANPQDVPAQLAAADLELASGEAERAFGRLIELVRRTSGEDRDAARTHLLGLFAMASPDDPVVVKARRDLTSALF
jgi:putative thioredoxin